MDRSAADCLALFDASIEGRLSEGWASGCILQRTKTVVAGPMVYVECYPIWDTKTALAARRELRKEAHAKAQRKLNQKNREKRLIRLINGNFGAGDLMITLEYPWGKNPQDDEQAKRDIVNYLKRVARLRKKRGLPAMRYIYVIEVTSSKKYGVRFHHHVIMSGDGLSRDEAEEKWTKTHGGYCNTRRAQPSEKHLTGWACYMMSDKKERTQEKEGKNPQQKAMRRSWNASKNLIDPMERATVADKKVSVRKAGRIAEATQENAKEIFKKLYPDCELLEMSVKTSRWTTGVYIAVELRRTGRKDNGKDLHGAGCAGRAAGKRGAGAAIPLGGDAGGRVP